MQADNMPSSAYLDQFITKTCLTTFTYLTTYLEGTVTTVSSHEQVVSNVATEEKNTGKILPTPAIGITLTQVNISIKTISTSIQLEARSTLGYILTENGTSHYFATSTNK